ncbi:Transmembrane protein [Orchesella cincta]|uniref:Transmembrane protein 107 n=1 Tax=Orchesella cincta TaxID=48709 RepID=A0A1D2ND19_ORCCI|nr:Transmembrane protein [Orchesella cincta]
MKRNNSLISTRYLLLMGHLILVITSLMAREENVKACLPTDYTPSQYLSKDTELIVALSLSIAFIIIELTTFGSGLTMFSTIMAHALGAILLAYFLTESWDCGLYWWIFSLTVCLPLLFDVVTILLDVCAYDAKYK